MNHDQDPSEYPVHHNLRRKAPQSRDLPELPDYEDEPMESSDEEKRLLARQRNIKIVLWSLPIIVLLSCFPTAYRALKDWRAEMFLKESNAAFAVGDQDLGITRLKQALELAPGNLAVQHSAELYNARSGDKTSLNLLLSLMRSGDANDEELLGIAELMAITQQPDTAREAMEHLSSRLTSVQKMRLILIEAALLAQQGQPVQAANHCLEKNSEVGAKEAVQLKIQAARYLLTTKSPADSRQAAELLLGVLAKQTDASLTAWRLLARILLAPPEQGGGEKSGITEQEARQVLEAVSTLKSLKATAFSDRLLAAQLEIHLDPTTAPMVVKRLKDDNTNASRADLLTLARWFNANGFPGEVISLAGPDQTRNDTDWLLLVLDATCLQGKWKEVPDLLNYPSATGMPDAVKHLYLARVAMMTGDKIATEEEWRSVAGALPLEKSETLAYLAAYEEQIGALNQAMATYREMANRKETALPGLIALIRCQPRDTSALTMIPLYQDLLALSPDLTEAVGDLAYLQLLSNHKVEQSAQISEQLLSQQPNNLARISAAALGRLRQGKVADAMALYEGKAIPWAEAPEAWRAIRVAVLRAAGEEAAAHTLAATIHPNTLRPEEQNLLKKPVK